MSGVKSNSESWKLAEPHAAMAQGIVVSGYKHLPVAQTLLLSFEWDSSVRGGAWLKALHKVAPVTPADGKQDTSVALGLTAMGMREMGVSSDILDGFSPAFREGMFQVDRMRRLNDMVGTEWSNSGTEQTKDNFTIIKEEFTFFFALINTL